MPYEVLNVIASENTGTPRDTVYPWGKGAHKQKSEHYRPDNAISKVQCAPCGRDTLLFFGKVYERLAFSFCKV